MEDHAWEIITVESELVRGEDGFPTPDQRALARFLTLTLPRCPVFFKVEIPDNGELIFFRRNLIELKEGATEEKRSWSYFIGFMENGKKSVQEITEMKPGVFKVEHKDNDGRDNL
jgi:hypothetical protein